MMQRFSWRIRFGLRTVLLASVLLSVAFAWSANIWRQKQSERRDIQALDKAGISVCYDYEKCGGGEGRPNAPHWLCSALGDEFFGTPVSLDGETAQLSSDSLDAISRLRTLRTVTLAGAGFNDGQLRVFAGMNGLESLEFHNAQISGSGLASLKNLTNLQFLDASGPAISDETCIAIGTNCRHLQSLSLQGVNVTDRGLRSIAKLRELRYLILCGTSITGRGLRSLACRPCLQELILDETKLDDASLLELDGFPQLEHLSFCDTPVRNATLQHLPHLTELNCGIPNECDSIRLIDLAGLTSIDGYRVQTRRLELAGVPKVKSLDSSGTELILDDDTSIEQLSLCNDSATDASLTLLRHCPRLLSLDVANDPISDIGLAALKNCPSLQSLNITSDDRITDSGVAQLTTLPHLEKIEYWGTSLTQHGVERLRSRFPKARLVGTLQ